MKQHLQAVLWVCVTFVAATLVSSLSATAQDPELKSLEERVKSLEQKVQQLESVVKVGNGVVTITAGKNAAGGTRNLTIEGDRNVTIDATHLLTMKAGIEGVALIANNGNGTISLNGGRRKVARDGESVVPAPGFGVVSGGAGTVFVP